MYIIPIGDHGFNVPSNHCHDSSLSFALSHTLFLLSLFLAAKKGSKVRIITAGNSDVKVMLHAARHIYHLFLSHGEWDNRVVVDFDLIF